MRMTICLYLSIVILAGFGCESADDDPKPSSDSGVADASANQDLQWFTTCGDPVCQEPGTAPEDPCSDEEAGAACSVAGASCGTGSCGVRLLCTNSDPKEEGCPKSQRQAKTQIHYLDDGARKDLLGDLLKVRLATYRYKGTNDARRLGFIIDDVGAGYMVLPSGDRVDVYGFASMAVAAIQAQEQRIAEIEAALAALKAGATANCGSGTAAAPAAAKP